MKVQGNSYAPNYKQLYRNEIRFNFIVIAEYKYWDNEMQFSI